LPNIDAAYTLQFARFARIESGRMDRAFNKPTKSKSLAKGEVGAKQPPKLKLPAALAKLFADPPVGLNEIREDYDNLFAAIAAAAKPADAIAWLFVRDITDLTWEIRRERSLKTQTIRSAEQDVVERILLPPWPSETGPNSVFSVRIHPDAERVAEMAERWATDPRARRRIDLELADRGYDASYILTKALNEAADQLDAIDRRIGTYELRRMAVLRATEEYNENLARRLKSISADVIEGQYTEVMD
jgi:hypothetical protein